MGTYERVGFCNYTDDCEDDSLEFGYCPFIGDAPNDMGIMDMVDRALWPSGCAPRDPNAVYYVRVRVEARRATAEEAAAYWDSVAAEREAYYAEMDRRREASTFKPF